MFCIEINKYLDYTTYKNGHYHVNILIYHGSLIIIIINYYYTMINLSLFMVY